MTDTHPSQRVEQLQHERAQEDGFAMLDGELRYVMLNEAMAAIGGVPVAEHLGRSVGEVVPALAPTLEPLLRHVLVTGEAVIDFEAHGVPEGEGTTRRWLASFAPIRSQNGQIVAIDVVVRVLPVLTRSPVPTLSFSTLQEREHFAASVAEASPYLIYVYDLQTNRNRYASGHLEQLYGYTQAELDAMGPGFLFRLLHPDDVAGALRQAERLRAAADGEVLEHKYRFRHKDGAWHWLCSHELVFKRDSTGTVTQVLGIAEDISARTAAQETLRMSEERFRVALQGSPIVVFNQDRELRYTWIHNPALGYTAQEVIGRTDYDLCARLEDAEQLTMLKRQVLADGLGRRQEVCIWIQGVPQYYDLTVEPLRDEKGLVVGITCATIDITERKRSEEALRQSNERLKLALDRLDGFLYDFDVQTGRAERSDGFARILGYEPGAVPATDTWWIEQLHPDDREQALAQGIAVLESAAVSYDQQYRVRHRDGRYLTVWDRGLIERDEYGRPVRLLGTTIDVTAQKKADVERAELLVRERQAHQQTEAALAQAEAATRERDLLISIAAHDLRTPVTVILGQAKLLQRRAAREGLGERNQRTLDPIVEQAGRLNQMIAALLDLSRIQEGRLTIQPEPLDLGPFLTRIVSAMRSMTTTHKLTLEPLHSPLVLYADPLRLEQVFLNLLGNAVKYSPSGGNIAVWAERDGQRVRIHISDQGIGIPDEALPHLFTRFYRAPNATVQTTGSLGIGLFVVRELVQAHGGTITVTTAVDQGSTFTVSLPLPDAP
jgi:PAS domain S-box-containing protein